MDENVKNIINGIREEIENYKNGYESDDQRLFDTLALIEKNNEEELSIQANIDSLSNEIAESERRIEELNALADSANDTLLNLSENAESYAVENMERSSEGYLNEIDELSMNIIIKKRELRNLAREQAIVLNRGGKLDNTQKTVIDEMFKKYKDHEEAILKVQEEVERKIEEINNRLESLNSSLELFQNEPKMKETAEALINQLTTEKNLLENIVKNNILATYIDSFYTFSENTFGSEKDADILAASIEEMDEILNALNSVDYDNIDASIEKLGKISEKIDTNYDKITIINDGNGFRYTYKHKNDNGRVSGDNLEDIKSEIIYHQLGLNPTEEQIASIDNLIIRIVHDGKKENIKLSSLDEYLKQFDVVETEVLGEETEELGEISAEEEILEPNITEGEEILEPNMENAVAEKVLEINPTEEEEILEINPASSEETVEVNPKEEEKTSEYVEFVQDNLNNNIFEQMNMNNVINGYNSYSIKELISYNDVMITDYKELSNYWFNYKVVSNNGELYVVDAVTGDMMYDENILKHTLFACMWVEILKKCGKIGAIAPTLNKGSERMFDSLIALLRDEKHKENPDLNNVWDKLRTVNYKKSDTFTDEIVNNEFYKSFIASYFKVDSLIKENVSVENKVEEITSTVEKVESTEEVTPTVENAENASEVTENKEEVIVSEKVENLEEEIINQRINSIEKEKVLVGGRKINLVKGILGLCNAAVGVLGGGVSYSYTDEPVKAVAAGGATAIASGIASAIAYKASRAFGKSKYNKYKDKLLYIAESYGLKVDFHDKKINFVDSNGEVVTSEYLNNHELIADKRSDYEDMIIEDAINWEFENEKRKELKAKANHFNECGFYVDDSALVPVTVDNLENAFQDLGGFRIDGSFYINNDKSLEKLKFLKNIKKVNERLEELKDKDAEEIIEESKEEPIVEEVKGSTVDVFADEQAVKEVTATTPSINFDEPIEVSEASVNTEENEADLSDILMCEQSVANEESIENGLNQFYSEVVSEETKSDVQDPILFDEDKTDSFNLEDINKLLDNSEVTSEPKAIENDELSIFDFGNYYDRSGEISDEQLDVFNDLMGNTPKKR